MVKNFLIPLRYHPPVLDFGKQKNTKRRVSEDNRKHM
jgi:hypothetical protein